MIASAWAARPLRGPIGSAISPCGGPRQVRSGRSECLVHAPIPHVSSLGLGTDCIRGLGHAERNPSSQDGHISVPATHIHDVEPFFRMPHL